MLIIGLVQLVSQQIPLVIPTQSCSVHVTPILTIHPEQPSRVWQGPIWRSNQFSKLNSSGGGGSELFNFSSQLFVLVVCIIDPIEHFKFAFSEMFGLGPQASIPLSVYLK